MRAKTLRRLCAVVAMLLSAGAALAATSEITAKTSDGQTIIVLPDGTWKPAATAPEAAGAIESSTRPANATTLLKAGSVKVGVWYDMHKWIAGPATDGELNRLRFRLKSGDGYGLLIAERLQIGEETLKSIALQNAQQAAPDAHVISTTHKTVNGKRVLVMQIDGTLQGIPFTYYGYYYGGPEGTIQVIAYTGQNLFESMKPDLVELLDGLQIGLDPA